MYALKLREQLGRISTQLNEITDRCKRENNRGLKADEREKFDRLADEYGEIEGSIARAEKADKISADLSRPLESGGPIIGHGLEEVQDTFRLTPAQARARKRENDPHAKAFWATFAGKWRYVRPEERANRHFGTAVNSSASCPARTSDIRTFVRSRGCGASVMLVDFPLIPAGIPQSKYKVKVKPHTKKK